MISKFINWFKPYPDASEKIKDKKEIDRQYGFWRWRLFLCSYVGYGVYYITRQNMSPVANVFKTETGMTNEQYGLLISVSMIAYGVGKFISGVVADRCNIRVFFAVGLMGTSLVNIFYGYLSSFWLLVFFWGLSNGFQSMGNAPISKVFAYWFTPKERASRWTIWASAHTIGVTAAALIGGFVLKSLNWTIALPFTDSVINVSSLISWRAVFYIPGIIGFITAVWLLRSMTDRPVCLGLPTIEEYKNVKQIVSKQDNETNYWHILYKYLLTNKYIWFLVLAYLCVYFIRYVALSWASIFLESRHMHKSDIPFVFLIMPVCGAAGGIIAGIITEKIFKGRCSPVNVIYFFLLAISVYGFYLFAGPDHIFLTCFFIGAVGFLIDGPQNLLNVQISLLCAKEAIAAAVGFSGLFGYVGGMFAGSGASKILDIYGWEGVFNSCIMVAFIGIFLVLLVWKKESGDIKKHRAEHAS